jgi:hypothetical protein
MNASLIFIKVQERLNKLASSDYDSLQLWQVREAYNKAQLEWVRKQIIGKNDLQEGDEETKNKVDDLQILLKYTTLSGKNTKTYFESEKLPIDYLYFKRLVPYIQKGECLERRIKSNLREEANVDDYLNDWAMQPSFDFEQTFHTLIGNRARVYTNGDFKVNSVELTYYRYPRELDFQDAPRVDGKKPRQTDPEFKDDIVELIIDDTVSILAGDIESPNTFSISAQRAKINT